MKELVEWTSSIKLEHISALCCHHQELLKLSPMYGRVALTQHYNFQKKLVMTPVEKASTDCRVLLSVIKVPGQHFLVALMVSSFNDNWYLRVRRQVVVVGMGLNINPD